MDDERGVHIHVGDSVGKDKAGGDQLETGHVSGQGMALGRRARADYRGERMYEDDLIVALNDLRNQVYTLHGRISALEAQMAHLAQLSERWSERPAPAFGPTQWVVISTLAALALILAGIVLFGGHY